MSESIKPYNRADCYVISHFNSYESNLQKPWDKPYNDQPWKRDLLKLDSDILKKKMILSNLISESKYKNVDQKIKVSSEKLRELERKRDKMVTFVR